MKKTAAIKVSAAVAAIVALGTSEISKVAQATAFGEVVALIEASRLQAAQAVNTVLIDLYWGSRESPAQPIVLTGLIATPCLGIFINCSDCRFTRPRSFFRTLHAPSSGGNVGWIQDCQTSAVRRKPDASRQRCHFPVVSKHHRPCQPRLCSLRPDCGCERRLLG